MTEEPSNNKNSAFVSATYEGVKLAAQLACVVYDEETGIVVHGHSAFVLEGGEVPSDEAFQQKALEMAYQIRELGDRKLRTLMVDIAEVPAGPMRVDRATNRLIADEFKEPPRLGMPESPKAI